MRMAEELAQVMFGFNGVLSETFDELFGNVFVNGVVNGVGIGMAEIILKRSPDVIAQLFFKFVHE